MWICKDCGAEVKVLVEVEATYTILENKDEEKESDDTGAEYYICECMKEDKNNVKLEDIAEWRDLNDF